MVDSEKLIGFLHTLWGKVAVTTAVLPGVAALFDVSVALENSPLKTMYPVLGTAISSFVVLLLVSRPEWFVRWKVTASVAIITMLFGLALLIFLLLGRSMMDYQTRSTYPADSLQGFIAMPGLRAFPQNKPGQKLEIRETWNRGRGTKEVIVDGQVQTSQEYSEGFPEVLLLASFVLSIAFLTAAFTVLGIHAYVKESQ